ncbi:GIY-YIG nuclease family protein [Aquimarina sp. RZ0]|uniref:GIY-YIG nuclease family protein n=1 Tax=Aquimarina sp. RZ0 TaxID=2607730 RepID=UPI0011F2D76B|nr:GIY-YIG nuclease family protein [Aquimarina sp. RZ0]KAA1245830.1 GIY-YIG nuclease family protein [Aquimarina sp. RZ0]
MSNKYKDQYGTNIIKIIYKGKVISQAAMKVQLGGGDVIDKPVQTNITYTDDDRKGLMHINHQAIVVGESVAQVKRSTTAKVTDKGTILVSQVKSEISSRGEEVYFYDNSLGTWEGSLADAQRLFPNVNFSELHVPDIVDRSNPEFANYTIVSSDQAVFWQEISKYDAEEHGGNPTTWDNWADSLQTGLDIAGLVPGLGEIADLANGCISLARGNYGDAALSFAAMVPGFGMFATAAKKTKQVYEKTKKLEGVYDFVIKNADGLQNYVGQSKDIFKRTQQHFGKRGKLNFDQLIESPVIYKMAGSTKKQREIYEQFIINEKYGGVVKNSNVFKKLLNKINPVGGRFDLNSIEGSKELKEKALKIAKEYNLPNEF